MRKTIEPILYIDIQSVRCRRCPECGGEIYPPGWHCIRCRRDRP